MEIRHGDIVVSSRGRRFRVVRRKRYDGALDTFRLESLDDGVIGNKRWTTDDLKDLTIETRLKRLSLRLDNP